MYEGGSVIELTDSLWDKEVKGDKENMWVVEYYAPWCGHCTKLKPEYMLLADSLSSVGGLKVAAVDATAHTTLASAAKVESYPTIKFVKKGRVSAARPSTFHPVKVRL